MLWIIWCQLGVCESYQLSHFVWRRPRHGSNLCGCGVGICTSRYQSFPCRRHSVERKEWKKNQSSGVQPFFLIGGVGRIYMPSSSLGANTINKTTEFQLLLWPRQQTNNISVRQWFLPPAPELSPNFCNTSRDGRALKVDASHLNE